MRNDRSTDSSLDRSDYCSATYVRYADRSALDHSAYRSVVRSAFRFANSSASLIILFTILTKIRKEIKLILLRSTLFTVHSIFNIR